MKIGVVSDTHSHALPKQMIEDFQDVDMIIHAGDFSAGEDLRFFKNIKDTHAVFGNMDGLELRQILPERDIINVDGIRIGLCHGHGSPESNLKYVQKEFKRDKVDVVVFGHSHQPFNEMINNVLYFNPGSPVDTVRSPYCTYGILEVNNGKVTGNIIEVKEQDG